MEVQILMYKIIGGAKAIEFKLQAISDVHAVVVCNDEHKRLGLIGRFYCETSTGKSFQVS